MRKKLFRFGSHTALIAFETIAAIIVLSMLAAGAFMWRLNSGPLDIGFAQDYIEEALNDEASDYHVALSGAVVSWPDFRGPLYMELTGFSLMEEGHDVLNVDRVKLGLSRGALLLGQIRPVSIFLSNPSLWLVRTADNQIRVSFQAEGAPEAEGGDLSGEIENSPIQRIVERLSAPPGTKDGHSAIDHLEVFEIEDARMVMEDHKIGITWFIPDIDLMFARGEQGLATMVDMTLPGGQSKSAVSADIVYSREKNIYRANLRLEDFDPHVLSYKIEALDWLNDQDMIVNGQASVTLNNDFTLRDAALQMESGQGRLYLEGVYDEPVLYKGMKADLSYKHQDGQLEIRHMGLSARDVALGMTAKLAIKDNTVKGPVRFSLPELPQYKIEALWPLPLRGEPIEEWLTQKISGGRLYDGVLAFDLSAASKEDEWGVNLEEIAADFKIDRINVDYRAPLLPITTASGAARFADDVITITIDDGMIGDMEVEKGTVAIDHVIAEGVGTVDVDLDLAGPLQTLFEYVALEPIEMKDVIEPALMDNLAGRAVLTVNVNMPTSKDVKFEEVKVGVTGRLYETRLPGIVRGLDVTGGPLDLLVGDGKVEISGNGFLAGRPMAAHWMEYLESEGKPYQSRVKATFAADKGLRDHFGIDVDEWLTGTVPVDVTYTEYGGGRADAVVKSDLTQATVKASPFDHVKSPGVKAEVTCRVKMENGFITALDGLNVTTPDLVIKDAVLTFETKGKESLVSTGEFPSFRLQETDLSFDFRFTNDRTMQISARGPFLDARSFLGSGPEDQATEGAASRTVLEPKPEEYDGPAFVIAVDVDNMRTHTDHTVKNTKIYLERDKQGDLQQLELDAVAGTGEIYFRLKPDETGKLTLRFEAADAGATLRSFGIYNNVSGGALLVNGAALAPGRRVIHGTAEMLNFKVINAPALARLLSVISPAGLSQLLGSEGIFFTKLESRFDWHLRRDGDLFVLNKGRTSGSSLGLTFEGEIDKAAGVMDIEGHIVPVSMVNDFLSNIPLFGRILSGGSDSVFAATYELKGEIKAPKSTVNPLAALTPGIIRRILFED